jgi:uncharacterized protein YyaL (SSP411 family)
MPKLASILAIALTFAATAARAATPEPSPKPVYDESANAAAQVAQAVRIAGLEHQRVLLDVGGNWCHWCTLLHEVFTKDQPVATLLASDYRVVYVDVGQGEKNQALLKSYGIHADGYPYLAVLGADNKLVVQQETGALEAGPKHDPAKVLAFLDQHKSPAVDANDVLSTALADAGKSGKRVYLHFGAGWCHWCHKLEDVLYEPPVADALESDFVLVKIDTERMPHADELLKRYGASGGIPWYAVLTADGKVAATSDLTPGNNIGFPTEPAEIDHVVHMFTDGHQHMTDGQIKAVRDAFERAAAAVNASRR